MQSQCAVRGDRCDAVLQRMTAAEEQLLHGRCEMDGQAVQNSPVICKKHGNEWLHRYKPTRCAACPRRLSSSGSMPCPEWMRVQLAAQHGAFVHVRPCYKAAVEAKKRQAADPQPMEVEQENRPPAPTFQIDVSQHTHSSSGSRTCTTHSHALALCVGRLAWRNPPAPTSGTRRCS